MLLEMHGDDVPALAKRVADKVALLLERPQRGLASDQEFEVHAFIMCESLAQALAEAVVRRLKPMMSGLARRPGPSCDDLTSTRGKQASRQGGLPQHGYVRLKDVLSVVPVSKSSWWAGVREGRFPRPTKKFGPRITAWDVKDIRALLERGVD